MYSKWFHRCVAFYYFVQTDFFLNKERHIAEKVAQVQLAT